MFDYCIRVVSNKTSLFATKADIVQKQCNNKKDT